jgi:hypothetical protein
MAGAHRDRPGQAPEPQRFAAGIRRAGGARRRVDPRSTSASERLTRVAPNTAQRGEHLAERPSWNCRTCGLPWPCANAKRELLEEFHGFPSVLGIYMSAQMFDASVDLTTPEADPPTDLYDRFVSWTRLSRPRPPGAAGPGQGG